MQGRSGSPRKSAYPVRRASHGGFSLSGNSFPAAALLPGPAHCAPRDDDSRCDNATYIVYELQICILYDFHLYF